MTPTSTSWSLHRVVTILTTLWHAPGWNKPLPMQARGAPLKLQPMVIASFLRLVTHPKIFINPTPITDALRFVDALLMSPGTEQPTLVTEWPLLRKLCADKLLTANDLPDAWLAAAVIQQGEHLVSFDGDFKHLLPRTQFTRLAV